MAMNFRTSRPDGRSNAQVLIDLVSSAEPGTIFPFDRLADSLSAGCSHTFDRNRIVGIVNRTNRRLLRECCRRLHSVAGVGYRIAEAKDHRSLSLLDKRRGERQMTKGLLTLQKVDWDAMDENERRAHEGTLMVMEALVANQMALDRRVDRIEKAIRGINDK